MFKLCNQVDSKITVCKVSRLAVSYYVFLKVKNISSKGEVLHGNVSVASSPVLPLPDPDI